MTIWDTANKTAWQLAENVRGLFNRPTADDNQIVLYTRGADVIDPAEYRRNFDFELERAILHRRQVSDDTLSRALPVSATAYSCTEYRATKTASIPLKVQVAQEVAETSPLAHFVQEAPHLLDDITRSLLLYGRFYLLKKANRHGWYTGLQYLNPLSVRELTEGYGRVVAYDVQLENGKWERFLPEHIIYEQFFDPEPFGRGLSKFEAAWRALNIDLGISTFAASFFLNHAQPDGMLILDRETPLSDSDFARFKAHWRENFRGAHKAHKTGFIDVKATWQPMTGAPKDLAMVELKQTDREDICAIFEVDPILIGMKGAADPLSANSTYSAAEIAHIRGVTIPFLNTVVLSALNKQWAQKDFDKAYTLLVDEMNVPALNDANLLKSETAINLTSRTLVDYPEARQMLGYEPREDYLKRNPTEASTLWRDGAITWNMYRKLTGVPDALERDPNGDVVLIEGKLYPVARLAEIAERNADLAGQPMQQPSPFGSFSITNAMPEVKAPELSAIPGKVSTPQLEERVRAASTGTPEAYAILSLSNNEQLIAYQNKLKDLLPDIDSVRWTSPDEFHITLWYAELVSDDQLKPVMALASVENIIGETFTVGPLSSFDGDGTKKPLILPVELTEPLRKLQATQASQLMAMGVPISEYSMPDAYKPHITLAYVGSDVDVPDVPDTLSVAPVSLEFSRGDYNTIKQLPIPQGIARNAMPLEVAIGFAGNQFVRYARRALSAVLSEQDVSAIWTDEKHWRVPLARSGEWTPALLSSVLRTVTWDDSRKVDMPTTGYIQRGDDIYLQVPDAPIATILKAVRVDLQDAGMASDVLFSGGIHLCRVQDNASVDLPETTTYPLVGNNVTLYLGDEVYHRWALRGVSQAQINELRAWRRAAKNRGRDYEFSTEALQDHPVAQFTRWAIGQAECELTTVFDAADAMLRGELPVIEFEDTDA